MPDHDPSYKRFFSHPEMVKDLLQGFVHETWVAELDFTTLEKVSGQFISDDLRSRDNDVIWRIRWQNKWLYVYILLEFQSSVDNYMAIRLMVYIGLLYQDLIKAGLTTDKLPPVLPIVLYNGNRRWTAPVNVQDLIEPSPLQNYQPQLHYLLIDEGAYSTTELSRLHNLVAALFRIEKARNKEEVIAVLEALLQWLKEPEQMGIRQAFAVWLNRVYLPHHLPNTELPKLIDLQEINVMLAERVAIWYEEGVQKGMQAGMQEGLLKGIQQGREEGREQGREEGREQGREQGLMEGQATGIKNAMLAVLTMRFGKVSPVLQQAINDVHEITQLEDLMRQAVIIDSLTTFQQLIHSTNH
ncbi:Rpn family recombination-promoting nuclease/putative transposase [Beggiatoa leptomitoformis]|uniref:Transposase (putative) YhgA-like domain-containing protein n=1 Tax=Beggiatoa leptomitoformis TaxID=288004 RepID=A0A2N9YBP9_9GAMM|nr:Rpn family recombination-promoting nuclease/putative transposase [Beggiatoa leptomitoformis]ALG66783.1 hypothetical protein AL038_02465 [Beggiatoa leptomitoformis]AUI67871.1 hypothetical protein BLE401_03580 [Beggiatoa leptomitoformis]